MIKEIKDSIFNEDNKLPIAHCISSDWALGAGIAKIIDKKYEVRKELFHDFCSGNRYVYPCMLLSCSSGRIIYNLVTKLRYFDKPSLEDLKIALELTKQSMDITDTTKISMPRIGCGLDKLNWEDVKCIINEVFDDKYEIVVYYL